MMLRLLVLVLISLPISLACSYNSGDPCHGDIPCCVGSNSIATCELDAFSAYGTWSVGECADIGGKCVDDDSIAGAACI